MKQTLFAIIAVAFVSSLCFAQQPTAPTSKISTQTVETKTFIGNVDSVSLADSAKGTKSEIVVVDEKGQKILS